MCVCMGIEMGIGERKVVVWVWVLLVLLCGCVGVWGGGGGGGGVWGRFNSHTLISLNDRIGLICQNSH